MASWHTASKEKAGMGFIGGQSILNGYRFGVCLILISALAWSTAGLFTRLIRLDTWTIVFWRGAFGAAFIAAYLAFKYGIKIGTLLHSLGKSGWLLVACETAGMAAYVPALRLTTVADVAIISATIPLIAAILGRLFLHERPSPSLITCTLVGVVGVSTMVSDSLARGAIAGDLVAFGVTVLLAVTIIGLRKYPLIPFVVVAFVANVFSAVVAAPFTTWHIDGLDYGYLAAFGFIQMVLGLILFGAGSRMLPAADVALVGTLETPLAPLWVWIVFAETPSGPTLIGGTVVMLAVVMYLVASSRRLGLGVQ